MMMNELTVSFPNLENWRKFYLTFDSTAASSLLKAIFEWLDNNRIQYCVERNYQGYPDKLTGDVDLVVPRGKAAFIARGIRSLAENLGWNCYVHYSWKNVAHLGFCTPTYPSRFVFVIELFAGGAWRGMEYLPAIAILSQRIKHGITWRPRPAHQAIITTIHYLLYKGCIPHKYRQEILSLVKDDPALFHKALSQSFGKSLAKFMFESIINNNWDTLAKTAKCCKLALISKTFRSPLLSATTIAQGYFALRRIPEGVLIIVYGDDKDKRDRLCCKLWGLADVWHIFLPPFRKIVNYNGGDSSFKPENIKIAYKAVRRGGVAIVGCKMSSNITLTLSYPPYRITCDNGEYRVYVGDNYHNNATEHLVVPSNNMETAVPQIWNFILIDRAKRNLERSNNTHG